MDKDKRKLGVIGSLSVKISQKQRTELLVF